jgi:murein DD-endopeptidase MepM/ murein hydrolase activator NlpD
MGMFTKPMRGGERSQRVRDAQFLLSRKVAKRGLVVATYAGGVDGIAGPATMRATKAAKWKIGYAEANCTELFGQTLYEFLTGLRRRTPAMVARAKARATPPRPKRSYPLAARGRLIGYPYQGTHRLGNWMSDRAYDIYVPVGTPVLAIEDGVIGSRIGSLGKGGRYAGLRCYVERTPTRNAYYYAHLSRLVVKAGQGVKAGQLIGYSGTAAGVPHLHLGGQFGTPASVLLGGTLASAITRVLSAANQGDPDLPHEWECVHELPDEDLEG